MAARIRLGVFGLCVLALLIACTEPPPVLTTPRPPSQVTVEAHTDQYDFIVVGIDSITPLRSGESGPNEQTEFRFVMIGTDSQGNTSGMFCPGDDPITLLPGDEIINPCVSVLAFDERVAGEQFDLLFIGVDEDDISFVEDLGAQAGIGLVAKGVVEVLKTMGHVGSAAGGPAAFAGEFALEAALSYAGGRAVDYFQEEDLIGQHLFPIYRRNGWGADNEVTFLTQDGGMRIKFHVVRASVGNVTEPVEVLPDEGGEIQLISAQASAPPTSEPPPPTPDLPSPPERLVLINAAGSDLKTLRDGDTIDLGRVAGWLDVRAETRGSVGSVVFLLDGNPFCPHKRCVENTPPYIMGGDQGGTPYGDWDWATLTTGLHTLSAYACDRANGEPPCSELLNVQVTVQR